MEQKPEWKIERISEDWFDYDQNDYLQQELLDGNFKKAPPISVAQYKARTCEVQPKGIFDEHDTHEQFPDDCYQEYEFYQDEKTVTTTLHDGKPGTSLHISNGKDSVTVDRQLVTDNASNKPEKQKKKKKKFKQFDLQNPSLQTSKWNQPWNPDFANKFKNNEEFPPL